MRNFIYKVDDIEGGYSLQLWTRYADIPRQLLHEKGKHTHYDNT